MRNIKLFVVIRDVYYVDDAEKITNESHCLCTFSTTPAQQKKKCGVGQIPFEGQVITFFTTLECQS